MFIALLVTGFACFIIAVFGIITAIKRPCICFFLYGVFSTLLWVALLGVGIIVLYFMGLMDEYINTSCETHFGVLD